MLKVMGVTRKVDKIGRITIPIEARTAHHFQIGHKIGIGVNKDGIRLEREEICMDCGYFRELEDFGRIALPVEIRNRLDMPPGTVVEFLSDATGIVIRKYAGTCVFCGADHDLANYRGKKICRRCISELVSFAGYHPGWMKGGR